MGITYNAFSDEAYFSGSRYRSISVVSVAKSNVSQINSNVDLEIKSSGIREFKWQNLRQAREKFAALKMIGIVMDWALKNQLRIDTVIWDVYDGRHQVFGRNDNANLQRMYFFLFKNVFHNRWPKESLWELFPDENSIINWDNVQENLDLSGLNVQLQPVLSPESSFRITLLREFRIYSISEVHSEDTPLCQIADLFAGLGAYSHLIYEKYHNWEKAMNGQMLLESSNFDYRKFSNSELCRFEIINYFNKFCKKYKLSVSLESKKGFRTFNPSKPINFWFYEPQHPEDKAPIT